MSDFNKINNQNQLNNVSQTTYDKFNDFIFSDDLKLTGKLLHRFQHFLNVLNLPGDIVEVGVFKGSGVASFLKFIEVYCPNSNKKVIGFDIFDTEDAEKILNIDGDQDKQNMFSVYDRVSHSDLTIESVKKNLNKTNINENKFKLVKGDVQYSIPKFLDENPGLRISLLYMDVDLDRPTYHSLKYLWERILPGGVIIFDEYEYHTFTESNGVDLFLKENNIKFDLVSTNWIGPTCYMYKK
jgi:hypothetical protein